MNLDSIFDQISVELFKQRLSFDEAISLGINENDDVLPVILDLETPKNHRGCCGR